MTITKADIDAALAERKKPKLDFAKLAAQTSGKKLAALVGRKRFGKRFAKLVKGQTA